MFKLSWKGVLAHKVRLGLTALAIVLGVAFVAGSFVFTSSMSAAFDDLFEGSTDKVDVFVQAPGSFGFQAGKIPEETLARVEAVEGVDVAFPTVQGWAQMIDKEGNAIGGTGPPTFGFSFLPEDLDFTIVVLRDGRIPQGSGETVIDVYTAEANGFVVGDTIQIIFTTGIEEFEIVGTTGFGEADNLLGATAASFDLETAQRVLDFEGSYSTITVIAEEGTSAEDLRDRIDAAVGSEDVEVVLADVELENQLEEVDEALGFFNTFLVAIGVIALFVAAFLISNTFRIIVSQRTRELAMLRAVGATGRQVTWMVTLEAIIVGLAASVIGLGVGVLLAVGMQRLLSAFGIDFPSGPLTLPPEAIVLGVGFGLVFTIVSAVLPAYRASRIKPVAALRETAVSGSASLRRRVITGASITLVGVVMLLVGLFGEIGSELLLTGIGAGVSFIGIAVIAPLFSRAFGRFVGAPLPRLRGISGRLARENAIRKPRRMAATASALMIGVALVSVLAVLAASVKTTIKDAVEEGVIAEYQVQVGGFVDPTVTGVSPAVAEALRELPEVAVASTFRIGPYRDPVDGAESFLIGVDAEIDQVVRLEIPQGSFADLGPGRVMVDAEYAEDEGILIGDLVELELREGRDPFSFEVVATFEADLFQGTVFAISMVDFEAYYDLGLDRMVMIKLTDGVDVEAVRPTLEAVVAPYPNIEMNNAEEYVDKAAGQIDVMLNVLTALLFLAILIALMGIMNTLALSIFERRREIGLLRAVGMSRRQVRTMIRWEAVLIAVFGAVIGLVVGVLLGIAVVFAIGQGLILTIPGGNLLIYVIAAAVGGVLASVWPAFRGARTDLLEAIAYE